MNATLEKRIDALEERMGKEDECAVWSIRLVGFSRNVREPIAVRCMGHRWERESDESVGAFDARTEKLAEALHKDHKGPVLMLTEEYPNA